MIDSVLSRVVDRLESVDSISRQRDETRADALHKWRTPLDLAEALTPNTLRTPALELVAGKLRDTITAPSGRLLLSLPPQTGKTRQLQHTVAWTLLHNPDTRVVYGSYGVDLARSSGRFVRQLIDEHGSDAIDPITRDSALDQLGISVRQDHAAAADWSITGHLGGMFCVGVGGGLTGRPADLLIIDDPIKDQRDADSATMIKRLWEWFDSVALTRLAPDASVIITQTRWAEDDLIGRLEHDSSYEYLNIPAVADGQTPDALDRPAGEFLVTPRGTTPDKWIDTRKAVGERVWNALYQGRPAPLEGGVFKREWITGNRVHLVPPLERTEVFVDPADNEGDGDEAGIIVAGRGTDGRVYVLADRSANMSVATWARSAILAALEFDAHTIRYERSLSQLAKRIADLWSDMRREANHIHTAKGDLTQALATVARDDSTPEQLDAHARHLTELEPYVEAVRALPSTGIPVKAITARGSKTFRMESVAPMYETGRVHHVGEFPRLEHELTTWQAGQSSPDRADALVHAVTELSKSTQSQITSTVEHIPRPLSGYRPGRSFRRTS